MSTTKLLMGILCKKCNAILVSMYRHHFVQCNCPNRAFMDGGQDIYYRGGAMDLADINAVQVIKLADGTYKIYTRCKEIK